MPLLPPHPHTPLQEALLPPRRGFNRCLPNRAGSPGLHPSKPLPSPAACQRGDRANRLARDAGTAQAASATLRVGSALTPTDRPQGLGVSLRRLPWRCLRRSPPLLIPLPIWDRPFLRPLPPTRRVPNSLPWAAQLGPPPSVPDTPAAPGQAPRTHCPAAGCRCRW